MRRHLPTEHLQVLSSARLPGASLNSNSPGCESSAARRLQTVTSRRVGTPSVSLLTIISSHGVWRTQLASRNYLLDDSSAGKTELGSGLESSEVAHFEHNRQRANLRLHSMIYTQGTEGANKIFKSKSTDTFL